MTYATYKILHLAGILAVMTALGGLAFHAHNGGERSSARARGVLAALHGAGLIVILVAGFGALAKLGTRGVPGYIWAKLLIWLALGAAIAAPYRKPQLAVHLLWLVPALGTVAAWLAISKPF